MIYRLCYKIIVLNTLICSIYSQTDIKSSLTFVIDNTLSMSKDINSVKVYADKIFDAVVNSEKSPIANFVIVTFQDPAYRLLVITTRRDEFKKALYSIKAHGGGDCPEMAMSAIELGLQSSHPLSYLFVFTDATAKDYKKWENVKHLALDLNSRITFLITKVKCYDDVENNFKLYEILAHKTGGEYFYLIKKDMPKILNYVRNMVEIRKINILSKAFLPEEEKKLNFTLDSGIEVIDVSVTGSEPSIIIRDRLGNEVRTKDVVDITKIKVVTFDNKEPGSYDLKVESKSNTLVTIYGSSKITFKYGFSVIKPSSLNETSNRPIADRKSFLAIKLDTNGKKLKLQTIQLLDLKGNVILEEPMRIAKVEDQFYVSEPILPPIDTFKIAISAGNEMTGESIKRISLPVEPQKVDFERVENKAPILSVIGETNVISDFGKSLQLKCRITGYPEPNITWEDEYGSSFMFKVVPKRLPYEYISVLDIDQITTNNSFTCKASNDLGNVKKTINVGVRNYFKVIDISKDKAVEYNKSETLFCNVKANPPVNIIWYQNGEEIKTDSDINISPDGTTLYIKRMKPKFVGKLMCEVRNEMKRHIYNMQLSITGVDAPKINKNLTEISVTKGSNANIPCRILKGYPKPTIEWLFKNEKKESFSPISNKYYDNLIIDKVSSDMIGTYKCVARNDINEDSHVIDLLVEYAPVIKSTRNVQIIKNHGETVTIACPVEGAPIPEVTWFLNETILEDGYPYRIYRNKTISFKATVNKIGLYNCEAKNKLGTVRKTTNVSVCEPVTVNVPKETTLTVKVGSKLRLLCEVKGYPTATIKWTFINSTNTVKVMYKTKDFGVDGSLTIPMVQLIDKGLYICSAENCGGHTNLTYSVFPKAPPTIIITAKEKKIVAVNGDKVLRIPCIVSGEPKPEILWRKDGDLLTIGNEWYSVDSDDTLIIKNIKHSSSGTYVCAAKNIYGIDYEKYLVEVQNYPKELGKTSKILIENNQTKEIECNVPHTDTDLVRWYKGQRRVGEKTLKLTNVKKSQSGFYKCRVSNFFKSYTGCVNIIVGEKPKFVYNLPIETFLFDDINNCLSCVNSAIPKAAIIWRLNKNRISFDDMIFCFEKKVSSIGEYACIVENVFGKIERKFTVTTDDCLLNIQVDFDKYHPLILTMGFQLPKFYVKDDHLAIPQNESVQFFCNGGFNKFPGNHVKGTCLESKSFKTQEISVDYPKVKCKEPLEPHIVKTNVACTSTDNGEFYQIGVYVKDFLEVYRICYHKARKIPLYAEYTLSPWAAGAESGAVKTWFHNDKVNYNITEMYDCKIQKSDMSLILGRPFHNEDNWCFTARQLVNEKDVPPGFPQILTHSYLNIIPHWNSDNMKNWDALEKLLRTVTRKNKHLIIRTGISQELQLKTVTSDSKTVHIKDKAGNTMTVPVFLWKVITDTDQGASVAIIQLNLPDAPIVNFHEYIICPDICEDLHWMNEINKNYFNTGFIYCCSIFDFEKAFGYRSLFSRGFARVLKIFH